MKNQVNCKKVVGWKKIQITMLFVEYAVNHIE